MSIHIATIKVSKCTFINGLSKMDTLWLASINFDWPEKYRPERLNLYWLNLQSLITSFSYYTLPKVQSSQHRFFCWKGCLKIIGWFNIQWPYVKSMVAHLTVNVQSLYVWRMRFPIFVWSAVIGCLLMNVRWSSNKRLLVQLFSSGWLNLENEKLSANIEI